MEIPSKIWSYWNSGLENAPETVKICVESWFKNSQIAEIHVLDDSSIFDFIDRAELPLTFESLPVQKKANAIRLVVLHRYGGIWLDASLYVRGELREWCSHHASSEGLLVFRDPGPERFFSNWFLAAAPGHPHIEKLLQSYNRYFMSARFHELNRRRGEAGKWTYRLFLVLNSKMLKESKRFVTLWTRFPGNRLPFYPYFIFHYLANRIVLSTGARSFFADMKYLPAHSALAVRHFLRKNEGDVSIAEVLTGNSVPVQKLSHNRILLPHQIDALNALAQ